MNFPRSAIPFLAASAVALVAGCGEPSAQQQVKDLVNSYIQDYANHDGNSVCSKMTPANQQRIQAAAGMLRGKDCAATMTTISKLATGTQAAQARNTRAGKIVIDGNEAGVVLVPSAPGTKPTRIVKLDGKWLIDGSVSLAG